MNKQNSMIDTHVHLNMLVPHKTRDRLITSEEIEALEPFVTAAEEADVTPLINVGTSYVESVNSLAIAQRYKNVFATVGIHPCDSDDKPFEDDLAKLALFLEQKKEKKIVGIGETGLDFYHKPFDQKIQEKAFCMQIELAIAHHLPLVIHVREAADATLDVLRSYAGKITGVIHCFSQSYEFAKQVIDWGLVLGIDGPITYPKNNELRSVVANVPLERLILETDAPFLPPQQFRGKQNQPAYLPIVARAIAEITQKPVEYVIDTTTKTALETFPAIKNY